MGEIFWALHRVLLGCVVFFAVTYSVVHGPVGTASVRNAESQSLPQNVWITICILNRIPTWSVCELKFGKHWCNQLRKCMECIIKAPWFSVTVIKEWLLVFMGSWTPWNVLETMKSPLRRNAHKKLNMVLCLKVFRGIHSLKTKSQGLIFLF